MSKACLLYTSTAYLDNISFISGNGRGYDIFQDQPEKQKKLIEAVKTDIQEAAPEDLLALPFAELHISYILPVAEDIHLSLIHICFPGSRG